MESPRFSQQLTLSTRSGAVVRVDLTSVLSKLLFEKLKKKAEPLSSQECVPPFRRSLGSLGFQQEAQHASIGKTTGLTAPVLSASHPGHRPHKSCVVVSCFPNIWQASPRFWLDDWQTGSYR